MSKQEKEKKHVYGIYLGFDNELDSADERRVTKLFRETKDKVHKLTLKQKPKVQFPVKPPVVSGK